MRQPLKCGETLTTIPYKPLMSRFGKINSLMSTSIIYYNRSNQISISFWTIRFIKGNSLKIWIPSHPMTSLDLLSRLISMIWTLPTFSTKSTNAFKKRLAKPSMIFVKSWPLSPALEFLSLNLSRIIQFMIRLTSSWSTLPLLKKVASFIIKFNLHISLRNSCMKVNLEKWNGI